MIIDGSAFWMKIIDRTLRVDIFVDINIFTKHLSKYLRVIISQLSLFCILKIINRIISSSINLIALAHNDSKYQNKVHGSAVTIQLAPRIYSPDRHDRRPQRLWVRIQVIAHYTFGDFTINMCPFILLGFWKIRI